MGCIHHSKKGVFNKSAQKLEYFCKDCGEPVEKKKKGIFAGDTNTEEFTEFTFECENNECEIEYFELDLEEPPAKIPHYKSCPNCGSRSDYTPQIQIWHTVQGEGSGTKLNIEDRKEYERKWMETEVENTRKQVDTGGEGGASPYAKYTMNKEYLAKQGRLKRVSKKTANERMKVGKKVALETSKVMSENDKRFTGKRHDG